MKKILLIISLILFATQFCYAEEEKLNNHAAIFFGGVTNTAANGWTQPSVGLDYEFKLWATRPLMGLGFFAEGTFGNENEFTFGLPINLLDAQSTSISIFSRTVWPIKTSSMAGWIQAGSP